MSFHLDVTIRCDNITCDKQVKTTSKLELVGLRHLLCVVPPELPEGWHRVQHSVMGPVSASALCPECSRRNS